MTDVSRRGMDLIERSFDVLVELSPAEVVERIQADPEVEWHEERPNPFFAGTAYQAWGNEKQVVVRRLQRTDKLAAPELELILRQEGRQTRIQGRFVPINNRNLLAGLPTTVLGKLSWVAASCLFVLGDLYLFFGTLTASVVLLVLGFAIWFRRRERETLGAHGPPLLGVVGRVLLPYEVAGESSPFRALPAGNST